MARKPVLDGGKRDEIIAAAQELFFENGYEATSVRMILDKVGGEVGMFYHYFKSKNELFGLAVDRFFTEYEKSFARLTGEYDTPEEFIRAFLGQFGESAESFGRVSGNMHWTIQCSLHSRTTEAMVPAVESMMKKWGSGGKLPSDIEAARFLYAASATLHAPSFKAMTEDEKYAALYDCYKRLLG